MNALKRAGVLLAAAALLLGACVPAIVPFPSLPTAAPTVPPTDTPRPTATRTPVPSATPTPTATPAPLKVAVWDGAPEPVVRAVDELIKDRPLGYRRTAQRPEADLQIAPRLLPDFASQRLLAERVLVPVVPFPTVIDDVALNDLRAFWGGDADALAGLTGGYGTPRLYVVTGTLAALTNVWGAPDPRAPITVVGPDALVAAVWAEQPRAFAIVPFDELEPRWKVLKLDGQTVLDKELDVKQYPLVERWFVNGGEAATADVASALAAQLGGASYLTNRDVTRMTVLAMTGVTAPSRHTMETIEAVGDPLYPAESVGPLLRAADVTHLSNEVSFFDDCPPGGGQGGALCGKANYIELLKAVGADVVELTGNHMDDYGREHFAETINAYYAAGMVTYGGGLNLTAALSPTIVVSNGNRIAFLGCNTVGPEPDFATADGAGSAPCDYELLYSQIDELHATHQADVVIFTYQYLETQDGFYHYESTEPQRRDFHAMADAGADIVSGSQAHQPQGFSFTPDGRLISYGLGNLFFDQMFSLGTRQGLIERHVIYNGRHISTELTTTLLYNYAQPQITEGYERSSLLLQLFAVSDWP